MKNKTNNNFKANFKEVKRKSKKLVLLRQNLQKKKFLIIKILWKKS